MLCPRPSPVAEISLSALQKNYKALCSLIAPAPLICVVKADAYGHGAEACVRALQDVDAALFATANGTEALSLAPCFKKNPSFCKEELATLPKLHVLGPVAKEELLPLCALSVSLSVHSIRYAAALDAALSDWKARGALHKEYRMPVSLKCESGMNRLGITRVSEALAVCRLKNLRPVSLYSHLAEADAPLDVRTQAQQRRFLSFSRTLSKCGYPLFSHLAASAALLRFGPLGAAGVRAGIALYGAYRTEVLSLQPVMRLCASVLSVKRVKRGEGVGYGTYRAPKGTRIACIGIGYADGLPPTACRASVWVKSTLCPIIGEVCMDRTMLDIGDIPVDEGETVTLFGKDTNDTLRFSRECGVSPYVLLSVRSSRTKRIFY